MLFNGWCSFCLPGIFLALDLSFSTRSQASEQGILYAAASFVSFVHHSGAPQTPLSAAPQNHKTIEKKILRRKTDQKRLNGLAEGAQTHRPKPFRGLDTNMLCSSVW